MSDKAPDEDLGIYTHYPSCGMQYAPVGVCGCPTKRIEDLNRQVADITAERDAWIESARIMNSNSDFYQGIVREIGEMFGEAARTSDDGSIQQDVLALKVPELVAEQLESKKQ